MAKILITGAGSIQSNGIINCLLQDKEDEIIGVGSDRYDLMFCKAHKRIIIPHSTKFDYKKSLLTILNTEKPDPDITLSAEDRPIGGLGIFMVKKSMDSMEYEFKDGKNILTVKLTF